MINIFIRNLDLKSTEDQLCSLFERHGAVKSVKIIKDRDTGESRCIAFVEMVNDEEARTAISSLHGTLLNGRPLRVNEARPKLLDRLSNSRSAMRDHRRHQI